MRNYLFILIIFFSIFPQTVFSSCNDEGVTIIYVNGIFTDLEKAKDDIGLLGNLYNLKIDQDDVIFINGYNPSHLAGFGDVTQVVSQALGSSISGFDFKTILMQIHPEVTTKKVLLIGHSQGTFYTNELYNYLVAHGVQKESIAVYNLATPASFVAGDGKYLTSGNDNLINTVREWTAATNIPQPLEANILIPISHPETEELWRGHSFTNEYLAKGSNRIISDVVKLLDSLISVNTSELSNSGCFEPPPATFSYNIQKFGFAIADPFAQVARDTTKTTVNAIASLGAGIVFVVANTVEIVSEEVNKITSSAKVDITTTKNIATVGDSINSSKTIFELDIPSVNNVSQSINYGNLHEDNPNDVSNDNGQNNLQNTDNYKGEYIVEVEKNYTIPDIIPVNTPYVGFGGDGGASKAAKDLKESVLKDTEIVSVSSPTLTSPKLNSSFSTNTVTFSGVASSTLVISQDFSSATTTVDSNNEWGIILSGFQEGTTTIAFKAINEDGESSEENLMSVFIDTIAPTLNGFSVLQCSYSLVSGGCLSGSTNVSLSWTSTSTDISYFEIIKDNLVYATTTNLSAEVSISDRTSSDLKVVAYDNVNNTATSSSKSVEVFEMPIVINEIAWAGTQASAMDEWIELYNRTNYTLNLSNIVLYALDGVPYIPLSGDIVNKGYYLIERSNASTTSEEENLVAVFSGMGDGSGLSNSGEELVLAQSFGGTSTTTLDATPSLSSCGNMWCVGEASTTPISMERKFADQLGSDSSNWISNSTSKRNGTDFDGNPIYGTPKSLNSATPPPDPGAGF